MRAICLLVLLCGLSISSNAQVYKWTDARGNAHYGDIPPPQAKNLEQKKVGGNIIATDRRTYEGEISAQRNPVALYFFDSCGNPCTKAQVLLEKRGVPCTLTNQEQDKLVLIKLTGDTKMPALVVGNLSPSQGLNPD